MLVIPNDLLEIKAHHTYCHKSRHSTWTGLNKADKLQGSKIDKLRNTLPNSSWAWLLISVEDNLQKLPTKQRDDWDRAMLNLLRQCDININPKNAVYVDGEFKDYIADKNRDWKKLQKALWQFLCAAMEALEFLHYDFEPNPNSLFEVA